MEIIQNNLNLVIRTFWKKIETQSFRRDIKNEWGLKENAGIK